MAKRRRLLVIEDNKAVRQLIRRTFEVDDDIEFRVDEAETIEEAKGKLAGNRRYDVVIIDWRLQSDTDPEGGIKVLDALNEVKRYMAKVRIVYTAYSTIADCVKAMKRGANNYIDKNAPDSLSTLVFTVKEELKAWQGDENEPDEEWIAEHFEELRDKYAGELIAFVDGRIVGHGRIKQVLLEELKENYPNDTPFIMMAPAEV